MKVSAVIPGLPAARGSVRPGDLIIAVNGKAVLEEGNPREVLESALAGAPGDVAVLTVLRGRTALSRRLRFPAR